MMIKPISEYTAKRKGSGNVGAIRKDGPRTPSGALRRLTKGAVWHCVYLVYFPAAEVLKVGMTQNVEKRMRAYRAAFSGEPVIQCGEFVTSGRDEARIIEAKAMMYLARSGFARRKNEWFIVPMQSIRDVVEAAPDWIGDSHAMWRSMLLDPEDKFRDSLTSAFGKLPRQVRRPGRGKAA